jgi:hypothetical protein
MDTAIALRAFRYANQRSSLELQLGVRLAVLLCAVFVAPAVDAAIDRSLAQTIFSDVERACKRDRAQLWGQSMCGAVLFVDPATRVVVANRDAHGALTFSDGVYAGQLPMSVGLANTSVEWRGVVWAMVLWPPPENRTEAARIVLHELWHTKQEELGFPSTGPANAHLDTVEGRLLLRLEMRALESALRQKGRAGRAAIADALALRSRRHALAPNAAEEERLLEMHEGLAEYSAIMLSGADTDARRDAAIRKLQEVESAAKFSRTFAYATGPAWGLLLDREARGWRKKLKAASTLPDLLAIAPAREARDIYASARVRREEAERHAERERTLARFNERYVSGPVLEFPLAKMQMQFDPNRQESFPGHGTVYETITVSDEWGVVRVSGGALLSDDFRRLIVPAPTGGVAAGDGWTAELKEGWKIAGSDDTWYVTK